ncbi:ABC transporter permease [Nocardioides mangrovicus]|uniref:ABC transporter permease n=1 Tax=Nocardioides mangrovicus TaxID=2478913 RepID=A0A3L8P397_9ACTN|nr:ABC transporter permease [Nocardioides mangrovicus]RLV49069.1 ABC transporter permease [Nocardioides mangrovicus]
MLTYIIKRLALALLVLVLVTVLLVILVQLVPGDPARAILGNHATPDLIAQVRANLGLDRSVPHQAWDFLSHAVRGDLGDDYLTGQPVTSELGASLVDTAVLTLASVVLALVVGIPAGIVAANRPGGMVDAVIRAVSVVLLSMPPYVVALLLLLWFAVDNHVLPALGAGDLSQPGDYLQHLVLPAIALAVFWWAYLARLVRASMLEVLSQPYVRTARAYGLPPRVVTLRVALKNALMPVTALTGLLLGYVLAGTVYVEVIFNRPGIGSLAISAVATRDWPVVRAIILVYAAAFVIGGLLADLAYRVLDPRLRLEDGSGVFV